MEEIKQTLKKYKLLLIAFCLFFLTFMFLHYKNAMGMFFDIPLMFGGLYNSTPDNNMDLGFKIFIDERIRNYTNFVVALPLNFIIMLFKSNNIMHYLKLYSLSYLIVFFLGLILNFVIAKRTKRYDIAITCFAFFCLFDISNFIWPVKEIHVAVLFYFALLQYLLTKEKLKPIDIIPISLIVVYLFESYETTIIFGFLPFVFSLFCRKDDVNIVYKRFIGLGCLASSLYMLHKLFFVFGDEIGGGITEWSQAIFQMADNIFRGNLIFTVAALALLIFCAFYKKSFSRKHIIPFSVGFLFVWMFVYNKTGGYPNVFYDELSFHTVALVAIFPVILLLLFIDLRNIKIDKSFWDNVFVIACICGILHLGWQINSAVRFNDYLSYFKKVLNDKSSGEFAVTIPEEDFEKYKGLRYYSPDSVVLLSIFLSDTYLVEKIIVPEEMKTSIYNGEDDSIVINDGLHLRIKTKYYDLRKFKEYCLSLPENVKEEENI